MVIDKEEILVVTLLVLLVFSISPEIEFQKNIKEQYIADGNTSVIRIRIISDYPDNLVPVGNIVRINLTLTNIGPSCSPSFKILFLPCKSPKCDANKIGEWNGIPEDDIFYMPNICRSYSKSIDYGLKADETGYYRIFYELQPISISSYSSWQFEKGAPKFYEFQAVSLNEYNTYQINKNVQNLTFYILLLTIVTIIIGVKEELKVGIGKLLKHKTK